MNRRPLGFEPDGGGGRRPPMIRLLARATSVSSSVPLRCRVGLVRRLWSRGRRSVMAACTCLRRLKIRRRRRSPRAIRSAAAAGGLIRPPPAFIRFPQPASSKRRLKARWAPESNCPKTLVAAARRANMGRKARVSGERAEQPGLTRGLHVPRVQERLGWRSVQAPALSEHPRRIRLGQATDRLGRCSTDARRLYYDDNVAARFERRDRIIRRPRRVRSAGAG